MAIQSQYLSYKVDQKLTDEEKSRLWDNMDIKGAIASTGLTSSEDPNSHKPEIDKDITVAEKIGLYDANDVIKQGTSYNTIFTNIFSKDQTAPGSISLSVSKTDKSEIYQADDEKRTETLTATVSSAIISLIPAKNKLGESIEFTSLKYKTPSMSTYSDNVISDVKNNKYTITLNAEDKTFNSSDNKKTWTFEIQAIDSDGKSYSDSKSVSISKTIRYPYYYGVAESTDVTLEDILKGTRKDGDLSTATITYDCGLRGYMWICYKKTSKFTVKQGDYNMASNFKPAIEYTINGVTYQLRVYSAQASGENVFAYSV